MAEQGGPGAAAADRAADDPPDPDGIGTYDDGDG